MTKSLMALVVAAPLLCCACKPYLIDRENPNIFDPQPDASVGLTPRCNERYRCGTWTDKASSSYPRIYKVVKPFYEGLAAVYKEGSGWGSTPPATTSYSLPLRPSVPSPKVWPRPVQVIRISTGGFTSITRRTAVELKYKVEQLTCPRCMSQNA